MKRALHSIALLVIVFLPMLGTAQDKYEDKYFDSNGIRIRYIEAGSGEPIVLIHGYTSNVEKSWIDTGVYANLSKDHRVIALDLRGHGKSDKPRDSKAYGPDIEKDVFRLMDHLNISRAHIVGYSRGGSVTAKLLTMSPERFLTATLGGSSGRRSWTASDARAAEAEAVELEHGTPFKSLILLVAPTDEPKPTEEAIRKRSQEILAYNDPVALAALVRARRQIVVTDAQMAAVRVPTLAVVGSADGALNGVNQLKTVWPSLKVVVIHGASHSPALARAAPRQPEFVQAIRDFITTNRQTSAK